ncbi:MAG: imelysin family protein [Colwellia sp.]|nr:imelysin family protein [Colwellia sp.]
MKSSNIKRLALALASIFYLSACGEDVSSSSGDGFNKGKDTNTDFNQSLLVASIVDNVITPTFEGFSLRANEQITAINYYCQQEKAFELGSVNSTAVAESKTQAMNSWRTAMDSWQQAEMMQLQPLLNDDGALRNNIYSWPVNNTCGVDLDATYFKGGSVNGQPYDITKRTASRKSMVAIEYLLFNDNSAHSCTGSVVPDNWNNETEQYRKIARCEFAVEVAIDIFNNAQILLTQWLGTDSVSGYASKLKSAGSTDSDFATEHDAVNKLSDAIFYLDLFTKDGKLAEPLGLFANECGAQACPEAVEAKYSQHSLANIINNLTALKEFMQGQAEGDQTIIEGAIGFRDYLIDVGDQETADSIDANIIQAINAMQAYQSSLAQTLATNPEQVEQSHADVKKITDQLKSDFINSLALELPTTAAGDND